MEAIILKNVCKSFDGRPVLSEVCFTFPAGEVSAIFGRSGCGKTTLVRILLGLEKCDSGQVLGLPASRRAAVFQENRLLEDRTVRYNIALLCPPRAPDALIKRHLSEVGLEGELSRPVRELSGGMKRRVALVRALIAAPQFLTLDEPFKGMDPATRAMAAGYVLRHRQGATTILVTHDAQEARLLGARNTLTIKN